MDFYDDDVLDGETIQKRIAEIIVHIGQALAISDSRAREIFKLEVSQLESGRVDHNVSRSARTHILPLQ